MSSDRSPSSSDSHWLRQVVEVILWYAWCSVGALITGVLFRHAPLLLYLGVAWVSLPLIATRLPRYLSHWLYLIAWVAIGLALQKGRVINDPAIFRLYGSYVGITVVFATWRLRKTHWLTLSNLETLVMLGAGAILWTILSADAICGTLLFCGAVLMWLLPNKSNNKRVGVVGRLF